MFFYCFIYFEHSSIRWLLLSAHCCAETPKYHWQHGLDSHEGLLKNATINFQFDFALIKLRKIGFPHDQTTWMQLNCMTWLVSPSLLSKFELEEIEFS